LQLACFNLADKIIFTFNFKVFMTLPFFIRIKLFQKVAIAIFLFFMGLMCLVFIVAMQRTSGSTGLDMSKVQQLRAKAYRTEIKSQVK